MILNYKQTYIIETCIVIGLFRNFSISKNGSFIKIVTYMVIRLSVLFVFGLVIV